MTSFCAISGSEHQLTCVRQPILFGANRFVNTEEESQGTDRSEDSGSQGVAVVLQELVPRIALLTPYTGGNFGDAAIQDALIANLRFRLPLAQFSGISLNCKNFLERHGTQAYPLCTSQSPYYGMASCGDSSNLTIAKPTQARFATLKLYVKRAVARIPGMRRLNRKLQSAITGVRRELQHCLGGFRFLRQQRLLVVSGGGQLDEEWGGAWGHPFTLLKWAVLARAARVPFVIASVGVGRIGSLKCRLFLSVALRLARYKSYRDEHSKELSGRLLVDASGDFVVPDLAFSFPPSELPSPADLRCISRGRTIVAISPISYAKPESWPHQDRQIYDRYLRHIAAAIRLLDSRGYMVVIVWSSLSDRQVVSDLQEVLKSAGKDQSAPELYIPPLGSWRELVSVLQSIDILIASRLHSIILGALSHKPVIAVSFDPKVEWVMEDLNQTGYLMQIQNFTADQLMQAIESIQRQPSKVTLEIASYVQRVQPILSRQYGFLAESSLAALGKEN